MNYRFSAVKNLLNLCILLTLPTIGLATTIEENLKLDCENNSQNNQTQTQCDSESSNPPNLVITSIKSPFAGVKPTTQSTSIIDISRKTKIPATLTELVEGLPGVAENSQSGIFQVISIRGVSRQRILTFADGVRLNSERRAGVSASFIDPVLLESVTVTRGPVSSYFGSGAIGGVTQLKFSDQEGMSVAGGYKGLGAENFQLFRYGDDSTNMAITRRAASNSVDVNDNELNTHFEQSSGYLQKSFQLDNNKIDSWYFSSFGNDLGRSNTLYPNREVNIPNERHQIFRTKIINDNKWSAGFYWHEQNITTNTLRPQSSISEVNAYSTDFGGNWQKAWTDNNQASLLGVDLYSRRNVNIKEVFTNLNNNEASKSHTLNDGKLDELALYYTFNKKFDEFRVQFGGRYTFEQQNEMNNNKTSNNAMTAFAGVAFDLSDNWSINLNVGNAFRFASLTELYFSGTTARGEIIGNPNLNAEQSVSYDFGFDWHAGQQRLNTTFFLNDFSDYIERIRINDNQLTFVNLEQGEIKGIEVEYDWLINEYFDLLIIATFIEGENTLGQPLSDIPSDRTSFNLAYQIDDWSANLKYQHRFNKNNPGNGEVATAPADILNFSVAYQINTQITVNIFGDNLTNETYVSSADDLATLAAGRNFGISFNWQFGQ